MKKHGGRIPELDGIRGVAILMVIVWHYFYSQIHPARHSVLAMSAIPFSLCWSGVDLFFVLSGFLIGGILVDSRESANFFRIFYLRRVCRIAPIYVLLLMTFGLAYLLSGSDGRFSWLLGGPLPALSYVTFTQNILMGLRGTFGATWLAPTQQERVRAHRHFDLTGQLGAHRTKEWRGAYGHEERDAQPFRRERPHQDREQRVELLLDRQRPRVHTWRPWLGTSAS